MGTTPFSTHGRRRQAPRAEPPREGDAPPARGAAGGAVGSSGRTGYFFAAGVWDATVFVPCFARNSAAFSLISVRSRCISLHPYQSE